MINYTGKTCAELSIETEELTKLENLRFYDVRSTDAIRIYGLFEPHTHNPFVRMPSEIAEKVSKGVFDLHRFTTGGRLRFVTDSEYVAVKTTNRSRGASLNCSGVAVMGFDLYINQHGRDTYRGTFRPPLSYENGYDSILHIGKGRKEITINLPLHHSLTDLYIGLDCTAELLPRADYKYERPVLYYGSSITQGASASRPGMTYQSIISRRLDCNFVNLGFSGNCRAEDTMIDYLAKQDCSVFVLDYDHNAPNTDHLRNTHEKLYLAFRETHPDTPVIIVTKPDFWLYNSGNMMRRDVIYTTYNNARLRGEKVIFVDGQSLFAGEMREDCTVDGCHPNDLGMTRMADVIGKAVDFALTM